MRATRGSALRPAHVAIIIAVILWLFLLMPWLMGPGCNRPSRRPKCMSNLKQIGLGLKQYALDFHESLPWGDPSVEPASRYMGMLCPTYVSSLDIFRCPSSKDNVIDLVSGKMYGEFAPFTFDAVKDGLSYAYGHNRWKPWTEEARSSTRIAADKYANANYTRGDLENKPSNHKTDGRNVVCLDGSACWDNKRNMLEADPETGISEDSDPIHDQIGPEWWSDPPEK